MSNKNKGNINYPVGDFLVRLKNAAMAGRNIVKVDGSKMIESVSAALKKEHYIDEIEKSEGKLTVRLAYRKKEPLLMDVKLISKPGLRIYMGIEELSKRKGHGVIILSTPLGIMSAKDAIKKKVGGEVIAEVF